jgi:hypothetical protein
MSVLAVIYPRARAQERDQRGDLVRGPEAADGMRHEIPGGGDHRCRSRGRERVEVIELGVLFAIDFIIVMIALDAA